MEFRTVLDQESCGSRREATPFESYQMGSRVLCVHGVPDLVLSDDDFDWIAAGRFSSVSVDAPQNVIWKATLILTPEAAIRVGEFGDVRDALGDVTEVFSAEELDAQRRRRDLIQESRDRLRKMQAIRRSTVEGAITEDEMIQRLRELEHGRTDE